jgi:hypothetical protein
MCKSCAFLTLLSFVLVSTGVPGQENPQPRKKGNERSRAATEQDYAALASQKTAMGRLTSMDGSQQLTLKVEFQTLEAKDNAALLNQKLARSQVLQQQQAVREFQRIQRIRNPWVRDQRMQALVARLQAQQANAAFDPRNSPFRTVTASVTFQLPIVENLKVARSQPEVEYDDKGQVIEYTAEELKKRRDPDMPGYSAKVDDLRAGQLVTVYLGKHKPAARDKEKNIDGPKDKEKPKDIAAAEESRPEIRMILILTEADSGVVPLDKGKGKKKKEQ